ncbi:MAG: CHAP domain-containing protein [Lachnospiraceae bacterium]|nr:CHAP domain-containing protein [Lachnospiraceae bacterium]
MVKNKAISIRLFAAAVLFAAMLISGLFFGVQEAQAATSSTTYKESSYAKVYDYNYYVTRYPSVKKAQKTRTKVLKYFVDYGMKKGQIGSASFNVYVYKYNYSDLRAKYGSNLKKYYLHYMSTGKAQGRLARAKYNTYKYTLKINPNGGTYKGSKKVQTRYKTYGTKLTFPKPTRAGYTFAGWKLTGKGTLSGSTYKFTMKTMGTNTVTAQWKKNTADSSVEKMVKFALSKAGHGGTEVWNYWGFNAEWCCMFVTYCADKGGGLLQPGVAEDSWGTGRFPKVAGQRQLAAMMAKRGQLKLASSGYVPKRGDIIFFSSAGRSANYDSYTHVGIVTGVSGNTVKTIEGNTGTYNRYTSYVKEKSYELSANRICAYGIIK